MDTGAAHDDNAVQMITAYFVIVCCIFSFCFSFKSCYSNTHIFILFTGVMIFVIILMCDVVTNKTLRI